MAGAGYDFNFLDFGRTITVYDQCNTCAHESGAESNEAGRYFWGNGPSFRLVVSDNYADNNVSHFFISVYSVLKYHNYENYYFGESGHIHCETADQQIFGMGFYCGYEAVNKFFLFRPYGGIGFRSLKSEIHHPPIDYHPPFGYPGKNFTEYNYYPTIDFGLIFLFRVR